ncbi:MAG: hypothetical protein ACK4NC_04310 [Candidatus Gracilibacteria bacterium]
MSENITYPIKHFRGQTQDERVILFFRKHWIVLLKYFFYGLLAVFVFIANVVIVFVTISNANLETAYPIRIYLTISTLLLLIFAAYIFTNLINYYLDIVIITNMRVVEVHKTIFFQNKVSGVDLSNIHDIRAEKEGFISNSLSFGNIILSSHTTNFEKTLTAIPTPHYYADILSKLKHGNIVIDSIKKDVL